MNKTSETGDMSDMDAAVTTIREMEARLDAARAALDELDAALARFSALRPDMKRLADYYGGEAWRAHLAADEAGLLPAELKRGVLSEDAVYDFLTDRRETLAAMLETAAAILREG